MDYHPGCPRTLNLDGGFKAKLHEAGVFGSLPGVERATIQLVLDEEELPSGLQCLWP